MSQDELITKTRVIQARHTVTWDWLMHCHQPFPTSHHRQRTKWTLIIMSFAHPWTPSRYKQKSHWTRWWTGWWTCWSTGQHTGGFGGVRCTLDGTWAGDDAQAEDDARAGRMIGWISSNQKSQLLEHQLDQTRTCRIELTQYIKSNLTRGHHGPLSSRAAFLHCRPVHRDKLQSDKAFNY